MSKTIVSTIPNNQVHGFESQAGDRPYNSLNFTKMHESMTLGGFSSSNGNQLNPSATNNDKILRIGTGAAFIAGHFFELETEADITINNAPTGQIRWDLIAIRIDRSSAKRNVEIIKIEGTPTSTDNTDSIPFDQLQNDELTLNSGIFEFPIAAVKQQGTSNISPNNIIKLIPSTNILEPFQAVEQTGLVNTSQTGFRILVPNQSPINNNEETTIKIKFPTITASAFLEATIVINDFNDSEAVIPLKDVNNNKLFARNLSGKTVEVIIKKDKTEALVLFQVAIFTSDRIDKTDYDFANKNYADIWNEFNKYPVGTRFMLKPTPFTSENILIAVLDTFDYDEKNLWEGEMVVRTASQIQISITAKSSKTTIPETPHTFSIEGLLGVTNFKTIFGSVKATTKQSILTKEYGDILYRKVNT